MENNMAALRKTAGLTQKQLADLSGVGIRQIQYAESGERQLANYTAINLLRIAAVLGVDPYDLIGLSRDKIPRA